MKTAIKNEFKNWNQTGKESFIKEAEKITGKTVTLPTPKRIELKREEVLEKVLSDIRRKLSSIRGKDKLIEFIKNENIYSSLLYNKDSFIRIEEPEVNLSDIFNILVDTMEEFELFSILTVIRHCREGLPHNKKKIPLQTQKPVEVKPEGKKEDIQTVQDYSPFMSITDTEAGKIISTYIETWEEHKKDSKKPILTSPVFGKVSNRTIHNQRLIYSFFFPEDCTHKNSLHKEVYKEYEKLLKSPDPIEENSSYPYNHCQRYVEACPEFLDMVKSWKNKKHIKSLIKK